jgi:hypothetical protein
MPDDEVERRVDEAIHCWQISGSKGARGAETAIGATYRAMESCGLASLACVEADAWKPVEHLAADRRTGRLPMAVVRSTRTLSPVT